MTSCLEKAIRKRREPQSSIQSNCNTCKIQCKLNWIGTDVSRYNRMGQKDKIVPVMVLGCFLTTPTFSFLNELTSYTKQTHCEMKLIQPCLFGSITGRAIFNETQQWVRTHRLDTPPTTAAWYRYSERGHFCQVVKWQQKWFAFPIQLQTISFIQ